MVCVNTLLRRWRDRADELAPYAPAAAKAFQQAAEDLETFVTDATSSVSLQEAHEIGGYSIDHLQRLVAAGEIENVGKRGRPRIRHADVPIKPGYQATLREQSTTRPFKPSAVVAAAITRSSQ